MSLSLLLALAVSSGVAAGVFLDPNLLWFVPWIVATCGVTSFVCAARGYRSFATLFAAIGLCALTALLGADAQHRAMYPSLRVLLQRRFAGFPIDTLSVD